MSVYGTPAVKIILNTTDPSGSFILNQYAGPQTGNFWVTGKGRVDTRLGIGGLDPVYALDVSTTDPIAGRFTGRVIGVDAVNPNEFITKAQMETAIATGAALTATQVGFGSPTNTLTGSGKMTFDSSLGKLTLITATGRLIQLGQSAPVASSNPVQIHMGGSYSDTPGANLKIVLYDNNIGGITGFGMSSTGVDYLSTAGSSHKFYSGAQHSVSISNLMLGVHASIPIVWDDVLAPKLSFYGGQAAPITGYNMGVASGGILYTNVPTGGKHALRMNGVESFTITGAGATITTVANDDTKTALMVWDSTDKLVRWRSVASLPFIAGITADNGLNPSTATNIQLGGPLLHNTVITGNGFTLSMTNGTVASTVNVINTSTGPALSVQSNTSTAIQADSINGGNGITVTSVLLGVAVHATAENGYPGQFRANPSAIRNNHVPVLYLQSIGGGAAGAGQIGFGTSIEFWSTSSTNDNRQQGSIITKWTTATDASLSSQMILQTVGNGVLVDAFTLAGTGQARLNKYGIGSFPGTAAFNLAVDATGKIIEVATTPTTAPPHTLLGAIHTDTVSGAPVLGAMIVGNGTSAWDRLLGQTTANKRFLTQTGTGVNSAIPQWSSIAAGDIPDISATYVPVIRTITINGSAQDLSANRVWTITVTGTTNRITVTGGAGLTPTIDIAATYVGQASIITVGTITTGVWNGTTIATGFGGTGLTSYVLGDILYASAANVLAALPGNTLAARRFLRQTGTGTISAAPVWDTITTADVVGIDTTYVPLTRTLTINGSAQDLSTNRTWTITTTGTANRISVTGGAGLTPTIDIAATYAGQASIITVGTITTGTWNGTAIGPTFGGTGITTYTTGDILYASATNVLSKLSGNITTGKLFLSQTGSGAVSAAPVWSAMAGSDITGAALTKTDDTNITLTLGGTPATALLRAASITVGWAGTLPVTRGGTGLAAIAQGDIIYGSAPNTFSILNKDATATRYLSNTGTSNNPAWSQVNLANGVTGTLPLASLGNGIARSVLGVTGNAAAARADIQGTTDQVLRVATDGLSLTFGTVATGGITNSAVTYAKIQNVTATSRFLGRISAGAGVVEELTGTQATSLLDLFSTTTTTKGVVPGSNGVGATFFLRADGTWGVPAGGGGGGYTVLTQFVDETPWRIFYSNAAGDVTPLAFGTSGQVLQSTGVSTAPIWATAGGSGTIGGTIAATQVGYGSALNTLTSSADFTFVGGQLTLNKATGTNLYLGNSTFVTTATPVVLHMGGTFSNLEGTAPKIILGDATGSIYGIGVAVTSSMDYMVPTNAYHKMFVGGVWKMWVDTGQLALNNSQVLYFVDSLGDKIRFYNSVGGTGGYNMGMAGSTLYYNVPSSAKHSFQLGGVEAYSVGSSGTTTMTTINAVGNIGHLINMIVGQTVANIEVRYTGYPVFQVDNTGSVITSSAGATQGRFGIDKSSNQYPGIWFGDATPTATTANFTLLRGGDYTTLNAVGATGRLVFARGNDTSNMMVFSEDRKLGIGYTYNTPTATLNRRLNVWDGDGFTTAPFALAKFSRYVYPGTASTGASGVIEFGLTTQANAANEEIGSHIGTVLVSGAAGAETFDFVISNMTAGAYPTEKFRSLSTGEIAVQTLVQNDALTKVAVWDDTSKLIKWRLASTIGGGTATIGGTIDATQVAYGSALNTIIGTPNFTFSAGSLAISGSTGAGLVVSAEGMSDQARWTVVNRSSLPYSSVLSAGYYVQLKYNAAGDYAGMGGYVVAKENAVDGEYGSRMFIYSRAHGGSIVAGIEMNAQQRILIGTYVGVNTNPFRLQVGTTSVNDGGILIGLNGAAHVEDAFRVFNGTKYLVRMYGTGGITVIGAGNASELHGALATADGDGGTAFGYGAHANSTYATAIGYGANVVAGNQNGTAIGGNTFAGYAATALGYGASASTGVALGHSALTTYGGTAVGYLAQATQYYATALGYSTIADGYFAIAIGHATRASGGIAMGYNAYSQARQFVAGANATNAEIIDVYFGSGVLSPTPFLYTIHGSGASGTDVAGAAIAIAGGQATGAAIGGNVLIQTSDPLTSGTTQQALSTKLTVGQWGIQPWVYYSNVDPAGGVGGYIHWNSYTNGMRYHDGTKWRSFIGDLDGPYSLGTVIDMTNTPGLRIFYNTYTNKYNLALGVSYSWTGETNQQYANLGGPRYLPLNGQTFSVLKGAAPTDEGYSFTHFVNHGMTFGQIPYIPDVPLIRVGSFSGVTKGTWYNPLPSGNMPNELVHIYTYQMNPGGTGTAPFTCLRVENDAGTGESLNNTTREQIAIEALQRINTPDGAQTPHDWIGLKVASQSVGGGGLTGRLLLSRMFAIKAWAGRIYSEDGFHAGSKTADEVELALPGYFTYRSDLNRFRAYAGGAWRNIAFEGTPTTAWRIFYSDGSGIMTDLALGSAGQVLQANGAAAAPSWVTPAGGGGGTPGGPNTSVQFNASGIFGGSAGFTWNGSTVTVAPSQNVFSYSTGSLYLQSYSLGNSWISENAYHNGAAGGWYNTGTSGGGVMQFTAGEVAFRLFPSQPAGTLLTSYMTVSQLKLDPSGAFGIGGNISSTIGSYVGAFLSSDGLGNLNVKTIANDNAQTKVVMWDSATGAIKYRDASTLGGAGSTAISALTAATVANTINNGNFKQTWKWDSLDTVTFGNNIGLEISSAAASVGVAGSALVAITRTGSSSNIASGLSISVSATGSYNMGLSVSASGAATNHAIHIGGGSVLFDTASGGLIFRGSTSGGVTLTRKAIAGSWTLTLPDSAGTSGYVLSTDGNGITSWVAQTVAALTKFGVAGQDAAAAENREFLLGNHTYNIKDVTGGSSLLDFWIGRDAGGYSEFYFQAGSNGNFDGLAFIAASMQSTAVPDINARIGVINTGGTQDAIWTFRKGLAELTVGSASSLKIIGLGTAVGTKTLRYDPGTGIVTYHDIPSGGAGGGFTSADNGLTASSATNVQLFGPAGTPATLLNNRSLNAGAFTLAITGTANNILTISNTSASNVGGLSVATVGGGAVIATSTTNTAVSGQSDSASGGSFRSNSSTAMDALTFAANQPAVYALNGNGVAGTVRPALWVARAVSGAASTNNTGVSIDFYIESDDEQMYISNQIVSMWTTVALATRRSALILRGINAGLAVDLLTLSGTGAAKLNKYGINTFGATPAYALGVDASGNLVEFAVPTGGGGGTIGGAIAAGQVAYGSAANTITGSADITFASGLLTLNKATGKNLQLGDLTSAAVTTPVQLNLGGSFSSAAGTNPKLAIYDNGAGGIYGIGVHASAMFYYVPATVSHRFYVSTGIAMILGTAGIGTYIQAPNNTEVGLQVFVDPVNTANAFEVKNGLVIVSSISASGQLYSREIRGRIVPRIATTTTTTSFTFDADLYDMQTITALSGTVTMNNPIGTLADGQKIMIRIKSDAAVRTLTWSGTQWRAGEMALPIATIANKTMYLGFIWNAADSKWDFIAYSDNY